MYTTIEYIYTINIYAIYIYIYTKNKKTQPFFCSNLVKINRNKRKLYTQFHFGNIKP